MSKLIQCGSNKRNQHKQQKGTVQVDFQGVILIRGAKYELNMPFETAALYLCNANVDVASIKKTT